MKALFLNGFSQPKEFEKYEQLIISKIKNIGYEVECIKVCEYSVKHCVGCVNCWFVTPGQCVFQDYGVDIMRKICQSELLILFTPITFGGFSSCLKRVIDRVVSLTIPHVSEINGREYHKSRYDNIPNLFYVGIMREYALDEERVFNELIIRNSINLCSKFYTCLSLGIDKYNIDIEEKLGEKINIIKQWQ